MRSWSVADRTSTQSAKFREPGRRRAGPASIACRFPDREIRAAQPPCGNGDTAFRGEFRDKPARSPPSYLRQTPPAPDRQFWLLRRTFATAQRPCRQIPTPKLPVRPFARTLQWYGKGVLLSLG